MSSAERILPPGQGIQAPPEHVSLPAQFKSAWQTQRPFS